MVSQCLGAEGEVGVEEVAQSRPVRRDQQLPATLKQVREQGPGRWRIVKQSPGRFGNLRAGSLGQRPPHLICHLLRGRVPYPREFDGDGDVAGQDGAEEVRCPPDARREQQQRRQVQLVKVGPEPRPDHGRW